MLFFFPTLYRALPIISQAFLFFEAKFGFDQLLATLAAARAMLRPACTRVIIRFHRRARWQMQKITEAFNVPPETNEFMFEFKFVSSSREILMPMANENI